MRCKLFVLPPNWQSYTEIKYAEQARVATYENLEREINAFLDCKQIVKIAQVEKAIAIFYEDGH